MIKKIIYFFPVQLLLVHLKKNQFLLMFWFLYFLIITRSIAVKYGIPYLFIAPEYLGKTGFWSYFIMGFSLGGFTMAFHISSYIMNSHRFPFIATLKNPFFRYTVNNSIIPFAFILVYIYEVVMYYYNTPEFNIWQILKYIAAFIIGFNVFILIAFSYFITRNKNLFGLFNLAPASEEESIEPVSMTLHKKTHWYDFFKRERKWYVRSYFDLPFKIKLARKVSHYDKDMLVKVFKQNHLNASLFELAIVVSLILLGLFRDYPFVQIPAAASLTLLFTMFIMLNSAFHSWLRGWTVTVFIVVVLIINYLSQFPQFNYANKIYGLNYNEVPQKYSNDIIEKIKSDTLSYAEDWLQTLEILEKWKSKNTSATGEKPKMVMLNVSGGGSRSALWVMRVLQMADSLTNGNFMPCTQLISGSSGGMIGAAYYRELYRKKQMGEPVDLNSREYLDNIAKDLLNPITFSIATNDFFIRLKKFTFKNQVYTRDRGYEFERQLSVNLQAFDTTTLGFYKPYEKKAIIPMMVFSPTILNDGRRLLLSSVGVSYLMNNFPKTNVKNKPTLESIEARKLFVNQNIDDLKFTSVIRMSATFPYIMPTPELPTQPILNIVDAGMRDNYGYLISHQFIMVFKNWLNKNTSGIIIVQIRDKEKIRKIKEDVRLKKILESISTPIGSVYENLFRIQDYSQDELIQSLSYWYEGNVDILNFELSFDENQPISLSWHLTPKERQQIITGVDLPQNKRAFERLKKLFEKN
ncbi:MAG TPA: hypothetical protein DIU39_00335 [Flavobacteriales bacterium]|nr:hypothetical protein [Flavobacteriales bacterium]|tara:strand:+ start:33558 stop:35804 length:2247 start_codon:yes stop_codon:yes gene_type:complete